MDKYYILISVLLLIVNFSYIRCLFKRLRCMIKIKKLCRNKAYKLYPTHPLWFFGGKRGEKCDLYIETPNEIFAIKLFGMPRRRTVLMFKDNGEYFIRSFIALVSYGSVMSSPINSKAKPLPAYNFRYKYKDEWEIKTPRRVLLINPVSMEFRRVPRNGGEILVGAGEVVNGMEIDSLPRLLSDLENAL